MSYAERLALAARHPSDRCQFMYNGRTGPLGRVCGRPESEHCPQKPGALKSSDGCQHSSKERRVHHTFTRSFKCPTCGTREVIA